MLSGTRTKAARVAGEHSTTEPEQGLPNKPCGYGRTVILYQTIIS